jgi:hypothetical protein
VPPQHAEGKPERAQARPVHWNGNRRAKADCGRVGGGSETAARAEVRRRSGSREKIRHFFPDEVAAIYRAALEKPTIQSGYFEFFRIDDVIEKALVDPGRFGRASDIPLLRAWIAHPDLGRFAIQAIKEIEEAQGRTSLRTKR